MKKFSFLLILVVFVLFAFFGYKAASEFNINKFDPKEGSELKELTDSQKIYILIHVDDLTLEKPKLVTIWGAFSVFSAPPQLMFLPLYPANENKVNNNLSALFKIEKKLVSLKFLEQLNHEFNILSDGYILVDSTGVGLFQKWANIENSNSDPKIDPLLVEKDFLTSLCGQFRNEGAKTFINRIRWTEVLPSNFSTNLSFERLILVLDTYKTAGMILQCQVLVGN